MADEITVQQEAGIKRERKRPKLLKFDRDEIANRVNQFAEDDIHQRAEFMDDRLQRYAKYRNWAERDTGPWEDSSDVKMPDMMTHSMKLQDILHNAIMSQEPPVTAMARNKGDKGKQETIDNLIQHQLFVDMKGTEMIGELVEAFVNDGVFTAFTPWIKEKRDIIDLRIYPEIPETQIPKQYFVELIKQEFPDALVKAQESGWDFVVNDGNETFTSRFYTKENGNIEMVMEREVDVFDGPRPIIKDIDDVLHPWRASNLQMPSPSNPGGAGHVILRDFPTLDEIRRLHKSGFYDLLTQEELDRMAEVSERRDDDAFKDQKDVMQGTIDDKAARDKSHRTLTRYMCFDVYEGKDVIWWMIKETKTVVKAAHLTEMYPANPPRRPFSEASMLPVKGRRLGISYLEMMEGLHDVSKELYDQMIDAGTIKNSPFFFYRNSTQNPENISLGPGDGFPMQNPRDDVFFPVMNNDQSFGINMLTLTEQMQNNLTLTNELSFGGIPQGSASALRTEGNMQLVLGQSESRPERILRRLFEGLAEMYNQIHELNQRFLPDNKKMLLTNNVDPDKDPYSEIKDRTDIKGRMEFIFNANMLNTSKSGMAQALNQLSAVLVSDLMVNTGIVGPDQIYNLAEATVKALGQDPREFIRKPSPQAGGTLIFAEEALLQINADNVPVGQPAEAGGALEHAQKILAFTNSDEFGYFTPQQVEMLKQYLAKLEAQIMQEQQQAQLAASAQQFGGGGQGTAAPQPNAEAARVGTRQQLSPNETLQSQPGER